MVQQITSPFPQHTRGHVCLPATSILPCGSFSVHEGTNKRNVTCFSSYFHATAILSFIHRTLILSGHYSYVGGNDIRHSFSFGGSYSSTKECDTYMYSIIYNHTMEYTYMHTYPHICVCIWIHMCTFYVYLHT